MNNNVVRFPVRRHARASSGLPAISAKASSVISGTPFSAASLDKGSQCPEGMPLVRQTETVGSASESACATALVPPRASMTESGVIMDPTLVCTVQTCQEFATRKTTFGSICGAIKSMMDAPEIIAKRLKALRKELGYKTQVEFAAKLGIDKSTYNPFETGTRPLTFETACLIRREFGIPIDWLFFGDMQPSALQTIAKIGRSAGPPVPAGQRRRAG